MDTKDCGEFHPPRIAVIADANDSPTSRWHSLCDALTKIGYIGLPTSPDGGGTVAVAPRLPVLGLWLMPDNASPGYVEDFAARMIRTADGKLAFTHGSRGRNPR